MNVAVIGYGGLGARRAAWLTQRGLHLAAVVDPDEAACERARRQWPSALVTGSVEELGGAAAALDAVVVSGPHAAHVAASEWALAQHAAVLCEKPGGASFAELQRLANSVLRTGTVLHVAANHMHMPGVSAALHALRDDIAAGAPLRRVAVHVGHNRRDQMLGWRLQRRGGGALRDNGWHALALVHAALSAAGDSVERVEAVVTPHRGGHDVDEQTVVSMLTVGGVVVDVVATWDASDDYVFRARFDVGERSIVIRGPASAGWRLVSGGKSELTELDLSAHDQGHSWLADLDAFLASVAAGHCDPLSPDQ